AKDAYSSKDMQSTDNGDRQQASSFPITITWETAAPVKLDYGQFHAAGNAMPQVRSFRRLSEVGELDDQLAHVRAAITAALEQILTGMQPTRAQLDEFPDEIASATLVAANARLSVTGVVLLDLTIETLSARA
ncbi:MAG: hypothetical protein KC487_12795, partial [Anaerolineae bacterium]|nr:hypothetical protein [Anaerolineae bacterium]